MEYDRAVDLDVEVHETAHTLPLLTAYHCFSVLLTAPHSFSANADYSKSSNLSFWPMVCKAENEECTTGGNLVDGAPGGTYASCDPGLEGTTS